MDRGMPEEPGRVEESIDEKNNNIILLGGPHDTHETHHSLLHANSPVIFLSSKRTHVKEGGACDSCHKS